MKVIRKSLHNALNSVNIIQNTEGYYEYTTR